jgi:hypothetical protein
MEVLLGSARLRGALGQRGKTYVQDHYTWDRIVGRFERLIAQVAQNRWW